MKRLTTLIVVCFCTVGILLWLAQSFVTTWEPQIRARLEKGIGDALHAQVQIDGISLAFFHRIHLSNVQAWDDEKPRHLIFRASDIALTISFIDLPRALADHNPIESIGLVSLESPWLILSPETLHQRFSGNRSKRSPPLLFTLVWNHGTFQIQDPQAPHGRWTLYQAHGDFKIRGPHLAHMELALQGFLEQADLARIEFSSYGHRWNAQGIIRGGHIPEVLSVAERLSHRSLIPAEWKPKGRFSMDVQFGGRHGLVTANPPWTALEKGTLIFDRAEMNVGHGLPSIGLSGSLQQAGLRTSTRDLKLSAAHQDVLLSGNAWFFGKEPRIDLRGSSRDLEFGLLSDYLDKPGWLQGKGSLEMTALGPLSDSRIAVQVKIPQGQTGRWPFSDADLQLQKTGDRWEFLDSTVKFLEGRISIKGHTGSKDGNIQVTGENLSLENAGRLNFSCVLRRSSGTLTAAGSFWDSHFSWGDSPPERMQGDFEIGPDHFEGQAVSEHSSYRLSLEGERTADEIILKQLQIDLPGGASLAAEGALEQPGEDLDATVDIHGLKLPEDAPFLMRGIPQVRGSVDIHGQIKGTLQNPQVKGMMTSDTLQIGSELIPHAMAAFDIDRFHLSVSKFSLNPGVQGQWTQALPFPGPWRLELTFNKAKADWISSLLSGHPDLSGELSGHVFLSRQKDEEDLFGDGTLNVDQGAFKKQAFSHAGANFTLRPGEFSLKTLDLLAPSVHAHLQAKALWSTLPRNQGFPTIRMEGNGRIQSSPNAKNPWETPLELKGELRPAAHWKGELALTARGIQIRHENTEPLSGRLAWDSDSISWSNIQWGTHWSSHGRYSFQKDSPGWSARLEAKEAALGTLRRLFYPASPEPVEGLLSGLFTLEGAPDNPIGYFSGHIHNGLWRAFRFSSDFQGQWDKNGLQPLTITAASVAGGTLTFHGALDLKSGRARGSLQASDFNLRPLGESLKFPKPLQGTSQGTFTVNGPMNRIALTGHVDGGPISYGDEKPFRLEHYTFDVTLASPLDAPDRMRLTVSEGSAKTTEEQIRLTPGSFVEFAGDKEARLQVGTEIRNLHLGLFTLFGGLDLNGSWQIKPEGFAIQGDAHSRSLFINDYELQEGHVWADYYNGVLHFTAPKRGPALITGTLDFRHAPQLKFTDFFISGRDQQGLQLSGDIGPTLWDFKLSGHGLDIGTLGSLAGFSYPLEGNADVSVRGTGDLNHPHVEGKIQLEDGRALGLGFHSGSAAFVWQDYRMTFTQLKLQDPGRYTLTGAGVFPLSSSRPFPNAPASSPPNASAGGPSMPWTADGSPTTTPGMTKGDQGIDFSVRLQDSNLGLLQSLSKEVRSAKGSVDGLLQITGSAGQPVLHGSLKVVNGDVVGAHYFKHLTHFNMTANFEGDKLVIHELTGQSGNGEFQIAGSIAFAGFEPSAYDLRADVTSARGLDVQVPELAIPDSPLAKKFRFLTTASHSDVKGHVAFSGPAEAPTFKGEGFFSNGHFSFPPSQKNPPPPALLEWFRRVNWDVDLHFADGAWFENELVEANLTGMLHLKGPSDRLRVDGGMDINEGKISYLSIEFDIQQARFDLRSHEDEHGIINTPYVRGIAQSNVQAVDTINGSGADPNNRLDINDTITLTIDYAPIDQIKPRLASLSNPNLSQEKLLARVTQLDTENLTPQERNSLYQQQMVRLVDTSFATPLARNLLKRTGLVDNFRVSHFTDPSQAPTPDPTSAAAAQQQQQQTAANLLANTKYTFEKNLSSRLSLGYGVRFEQTTAPDLITTKLDLVNDVELSYRWFRNVYLRGSFDLPSSDSTIQPDRKVTIEPRWRFGWWGNTNKPKEKPTAPATSPLTP